jgi:hypothetical protein
LVKDLKSFCDYVLHGKVTTFVPHVVVKDILGEQYYDGRREKWIARIQEYDLEIKPTKLIKDQGLAKLMVESKFKTLGINELNYEFSFGNDMIQENEKLLEITESLKPSE